MRHDKDGCQICGAMIDVEDTICELCEEEGEIGNDDIDDAGHSGWGW